MTGRVPTLRRQGTGIGRQGARWCIYMCYPVLTVTNRRLRGFRVAAGSSHPASADRPTDRTIILAIRAAFSLALATAVAQFVDYGVFDLRLQAFNSNTHASIFGAVSLIANAVAVVAALLLARQVRAKTLLVLACVLTALFVMRVISPTHVLILALPFTGIALGILWRQSDVLDGGGLRVLRAGSLLLVSSFFIHLAELRSLLLPATDVNSWAYQTQCVLKHDAELAGWILIAGGLLAALSADLDRLPSSERGSPYRRGAQAYPPR